MPDIPTDDQHTTHLGWQHSDIDKYDDRDHLVIDGSFEQQQASSNSPVISFENLTEELKQPPHRPNQPSFINVDSAGLESPLDLLGSNEPLDDQAAPPLVWFGDKTDPNISLEDTDRQVFD